MMWKYIRLKVSPCHSSKLIKMPLVDKSFIYVSLLLNTNKVQRFFLQKKKETSNNNQINSFLRKITLLSINIWLFLIANASMCNLSNRDCYNVRHFLLSYVIVKKWRWRYKTSDFFNFNWIIIEYCWRYSSINLS